jgi:hypothetical protein
MPIKKFAGLPSFITSCAALVIPVLPPLLLAPPVLEPLLPGAPPLALGAPLVSAPPLLPLFPLLPESPPALPACGVDEPQATSSPNSAAPEKRPENLVIELRYL